MYEIDMLGMYEMKLKKIDWNTGMECVSAGIGEHE